MRRKHTIFYGVDRPSSELPSEIKKSKLEEKKIPILKYDSKDFKPPIVSKNANSGLRESKKINERPSKMVSTNQISLISDESKNHEKATQFYSNAKSNNKTLNPIVENQSIEKDKVADSQHENSKQSCTTTTSTNATDVYYSVLWCNRSKKIHKTYDNGFIIITFSKITLFDSECSQLAQTRLNNSQTNLNPNKELTIGDKEVKIDSKLDKEEIEKLESKRTCNFSDIERKPKKTNPTISANQAYTLPNIQINHLVMKKNPGPLHLESRAPERSVQKNSFNPFDPTIPGNFLLYQPKDNIDQVPVVLEAFLAKIMRPHQIQGVKFMYECISGLRSDLIQSKNSNVIRTRKVSSGKSGKGYEVEDEIDINDDRKFIIDQELKNPDRDLSDIIETHGNDKVEEQENTNKINGTNGTNTKNTNKTIDNTTGRNPKSKKIPNQITAKSSSNINDLGLVTDDSITNFTIQGCILADIMGLGKTLQSIALIRVLIKQSPIPGRAQAQKVIILCPSSLVFSWKNEVKKWLGKARLDPVVVSDSSKSFVTNQIKDFATNPQLKLLIISYEQFSVNFKIIEPIKFDLVLCDEGHRLKNSNSRITQNIKDLQCEHRILLTGTPFQNNMSEYYQLADLVNPGIFGTRESFRHNFEKPILQSRKQNASKFEIEQGQLKSQKLADIAKLFILRRTSEVLATFLPPKIEQVIFCRLTDIQKKVYKKILMECPYTDHVDAEIGDSCIDYSEIENYYENDNDQILNTDKADEFINYYEENMNDDLELDHSEGSPKSRHKNIEYEDFSSRKLTTLSDSALTYIIKLGKVCNHPGFVIPTPPKSSSDIENLSIFSDYFPRDEKLDFRDSDLYQKTVNKILEDLSLSGKLIVLEQLLIAIKERTMDKVVFVSGSRKTLDIMEGISNKNKWSFFRLDGSVDIAQRGIRVDSFQTDPSIFLFLLSTKAGGVGLNLHSANRLILFDGTWNPAIDLQAQARVWREGQTKETYIYRFLATSTIDEKVFQRQIVKMDMSKRIVDGYDDQILGEKEKFSSEELKQIFFYDENTKSDTFDMLDRDKEYGEKISNADFQYLDNFENMNDEILKIAFEKTKDIVSFLFYRESSQSKKSQNH